MSTVGHPIVIRRADVADADAMQAIFSGRKVIAGTLQIPYPSVEAWRKRLQDGTASGHTLVASIDGSVVGMGGLHPGGRSPRRHHVGDLFLAVRDDAQGRGVGSALMRATLDLADNWLNLQRVELWVFTDNLAAVALYRKFGFVVEGTCRAHAFRDGRYCDTYAMARLHPSFGGNQQ
jgi:putative acetyltransferase